MPLRAGSTPACEDSAVHRTRSTAGLNAYFEGDSASAGSNSNRSATASSTTGKTGSTTNTPSPSCGTETAGKKRQAPSLEISGIYPRRRGRRVDTSGTSTQLQAWWTMFLSDQSIRHHTRRFGAALSPSHKWPPPTETQRIARWSERSEMLGALSVLLFWAFGFGILLGVGAITTGIFALRRHP